MELDPKQRSLVKIHDDFGRQTTTWDERNLTRSLHVKLKDIWRQAGDPWTYTRIK
ncbi:MAG: hypothetical protein AAGD14_19700 [Planctomycetota bacterium]